MIKIFAAVVAAATLAGIAVMIPGLTPTVEAHMMAAKGDRLDIKTFGPSCSANGWPYFERTCLRDASSPTHEARVVRVVRAERIELPGYRAR